MTILCKDCKHYFCPVVEALARPRNRNPYMPPLSLLVAQGAYCKRTDVIYGTGGSLFRPTAEHCMVERSEAGDCGPDARLFEAKEPEREPETPQPRKSFWQRLLGTGA